MTDKPNTNESSQDRWKAVLKRMKDIKSIEKNDLQNSKKMPQKLIDSSMEEETKSDGPKRSFNYEEWERGTIREGEAIWKGIDPRTI